MSLDNDDLLERLSLEAEFQDNEKNNDKDEMELPDLTANFTQIPNAVWDKWLPLFKNLAEMKVVHYLLRHTYGFKKPFECLTLRQFCNGVEKADGTKMDKGTGLSKPSVIKGLEDAQKSGFILIHKWGPPGEEKKLFFINNRRSKKLLSMIQRGAVTPDYLLNGMKMEMLSRKYPGMGQNY